MTETVEMDANGTHNEIAVHMAGNEPASRRRLRSLVWNDFAKERKPDGNYVAICNHCKKQFSASSRSGTTHLKNHLVTCTSTKVRKRRKLTVRRFGSKDDTNDGASDISPFDQELSRRDFARMVVMHAFPFTMIHHAGFKAFVKNLQPQFTFMSDDVVRMDCMNIYEGEKVKLREFLGKLPCRVSLSVDMWRSNEDVEYVCLTCHYIDDDWKLKRKILNFLHVETSISGEDIAKIIVERLLDWNLYGKLFSVILDNCNESDVVAKDLREFVLLKSFFPLNGEFFHVQTAASVMYAIAQDVLCLVNDIVSKVRDTVQHVRSSQTKLDAFQIAAGKVGAPQKPLICDDQNNWITTYLMLETVCEYQAAFTCLAECDSEHMSSLSSEEWDLAKAVTECLYVFYHAIEKFSETKIPTSNLYFNDLCGIHLLIKTWKASNLPVIATMATQILESFEKKWESTVLLLAISSILDPRYKMKSIEYFFNNIYDDECKANEKIDKVRQYLGKLHDHYAERSNNISNNQAFLCYDENNNSCSVELKTGSESKNSSRTLFDARRGLDQYLQETSSSQQQISDLELYLDEAVYQCKGSEDNFNILAWWKFHAAKYPVLSIMARDILGIPVSIVSIDGENRVLNQYYSSLDPVTVQGLICGQDWLREEFEVQAEPPAPADDIATVPVAAKYDSDVDERM
ncbi:zinc finger BED domain-containing protein RICESLEEPER 1-like, partial [Asparagus officinalis]|uniref:zinc finger BED domain-containing protein RICESLEEPER 1-like n=1 Tax=Asparagus officinalis TaxID=4686 RepID=UPI00098E67FA